MAIYPEKLLAHKFENVKFTMGLYDDGRFMIKNNNVAENVPPFYRVRVEIFTSPRSKINGEVWLPVEWNGILLGIGNGGVAEKIEYSGLTKYIHDNYAIWHSDLGTSDGIHSGFENEDVVLDFAWRTNKYMTLLAKEMVEVFYGEKQKYAYFTGGSTGGNQALCFAQRFPDYYDGIVATVPAIHRSKNNIYTTWAQQALHREDGKPMFTIEQIDQISLSAAKFHTSIGIGEPGDDFVTTPVTSLEDIRKFLAFLKKEMPELDDTQINALEKVYWGPHNLVTGERIFYGTPIGSEVNMSGMRFWLRGTYHLYLGYWTIGKTFTLFDYDTDTLMEKYYTRYDKEFDMVDTDLSKFRDHGSKLLMITGSGDPCIPYLDSKQYYEDVLAKMGGYEEVSKFFRYYIFPGRGHTQTGRGTNAEIDETGCDDNLIRVRRWVEEGIAPTTIYAVGYNGSDAIKSLINKEGGIKFKRPIEPYGSK